MSSQFDNAHPYTNPSHFTNSEPYTNPTSHFTSAQSCINPSPNSNNTQPCINPLSHITNVQSYTSSPSYLTITKPTSTCVNSTSQSNGSPSNPVQQHLTPAYQYVNIPHQMKSYDILPPSNIIHPTYHHEINKIQTLIEETIKYVDKIDSDFKSCKMFARVVTTDIQIGNKDASNYKAHANIRTLGHDVDSQLTSYYDCLELTSINIDKNEKTDLDRDPQHIKSQLNDYLADCVKQLSETLRTCRINDPCMDERSQNYICAQNGKNYSVDINPNNSNNSILKSISYIPDNRSDALTHIGSMPCINQDNAKDNCQNGIHCKPTKPNNVYHKSTPCIDDNIPIHDTLRYESKSPYKYHDDTTNNCEDTKCHETPNPNNTTFESTPISDNKHGMDIPTSKSEPPYGYQDKKCHNDISYRGYLPTGTLKYRNTMDIRNSDPFIETNIRIIIDDG